MYSSCAYAVRVDPWRVSETFESNTGVMQGCQLSPILFVLVIDELVDFLLDVPRTYPPAFGAVDIPLLLFADDVSLLSCSAGGLQMMLNRLEEFCSTYKLNVNVDKSKVMVFSTSRVHKFRWRYKGEPLELVKDFSYLGMLFSSSMHWSNHISRSKLKATISRKVLEKFLFRSRQPGGVKLALRLYKTMVEPVMLYGGELLAFDKLDDLELVNRAFYRSILGLARSAPKAGLLQLIGCSTLKCQFILRALKFWLSISRRPPSSIVRMVFDHMKKANIEDSWEYNLQREIGRLGFSSWWNDTELSVENHKPIIKVLKQRIQDIDQAKLRQELSSLKCAPIISQICDSAPCIVKPLTFFKSLELRRLYAKLCLLCPGNMLDRSDRDLTRCSACRMIIPRDKNLSIFLHRILRCEKFTKRRQKVKSCTWFRKATRLPALLFIKYLARHATPEALWFFV